MWLQKNLKLHLSHICLLGTMAFSSLCLTISHCQREKCIYEKQKAQSNAKAGVLCNITNKL